MIEKIRASYWLKSGSFSVLSQFSNVFFGFINFYFLLRILDKNDFGVWTLFLSVATFMELVKNGFITSPLVRYSMVEEKREYTNILSASLVLNMVVTAFQIVTILSLSFFLSDVWSSPQLQNLFLIFLVATVLLIPATHFSAIQQANLNFKGNLYSNIARQFTFFVFVSISYWFDIKFELWHLAVIHSFSILVSVLVAYYNVRTFLSFSFTVSRKWIAELAQYGKYTFGTNISSTVLRNVDTWMLGAMLSPAAVTIYNPAMRIANIVEVPTVSLSSIFFPKLLSRFATEGAPAAKDMYEKSVGVLFAFMFPVVLVTIVLADPIVNFVAGEGFDETVDILRIAMVTGLIIPFNRQVGVTLDAMGKAKTNFYFVLRNAGLNIFLSYFYIQYFGIIGAAYGMLTTFVFSFAYNQFYIQRLIGVNFLNIFKHAFLFQKKFIFFVLDFVLSRKVNRVD
ncbi:MAG TPA: flippase [Chryseolinea sp.]|nr:flippase [Chryseolinea sp.]